MDFSAWPPDSYQVGDLANYFPEAPVLLNDYMLAPYWVFRDANWSPDFPTAAQQLASFYEMGQGKRVDALAPSWMARLQNLQNSATRFPSSR